MIADAAQPMRCRLCGSDQLTLFYTAGNRDEFKFYRCAQCRLVNYDLSGGLNQAKYERDYVDPRQDSHPLFAAKDQTYTFLRTRVNPPGRLLDIGCGFGRLLYLAKQDGWRAQGLELSQDLADKARAALGIEVGVGDFVNDELGIGDNFDLVIMSHVLEHLPDSVRAMQRLNDLMRPGGRAVLEFPNIDAVDLKIKRFMRRSYLHRKRYPPDFVPGHCNEFCRESFEYLIDRTGFYMLEWETYSSKPVRSGLYRALGLGNKARVLLEKQAI